MNSPRTLIDIDRLDERVEVRSLNKKKVNVRLKASVSLFLGDGDLKLFLIGLIHHFLVLVGSILKFH